MGLKSQSAINPRHKSCPIKADQSSIVLIKFIPPSSSFGPSLECPVLESAQISWINPLSASLIFLDLALVIGPTGTCNESLNVLWFSSSFYFNNEMPQFNLSSYFGNGIVTVQLFFSLSSYFDNSIAKITFSLSSLYFLETSLSSLWSHHFSFLSHIFFSQFR